MFEIVKELASYGLNLLADAVKLFGKRKVEEAIGTYIPEKIDEKEAERLKRIEMEYEEVLMNMILSFKKEEVKDRVDAREREISVLKIPYAPIINKIFQPILALIVVLASFYFAYVAIYSNIPKNRENLLFFILGSIFGGGFTVVVNYYFGSSDETSKNLTQGFIDKHFSSKEEK